MSASGVQYDLAFLLRNGIFWNRHAVGGPERTEISSERDDEKNYVDCLNGFLMCYWCNAAFRLI